MVEVHWQTGVEAYVTPVGPERVGVAFLWSDGKGDFDTFLARFPAIAERLGQAPPEDGVRGAGPFDVTAETQVKGRILLVGDAAGYVDPLTGEGVSLALEAGAALVSAALANEPGRYPEEWRRLFRRHERITRLVLAIADRPRLRTRVVRALARSPSAFQAFLALNTGAWSVLRALPRAGGLGVGLLTG
jgi:flavin-dependent dehydrogenase